MAKLTPLQNISLAVGIGVGIHTGNISIGEVGDACRDFTAIGKVVNLSSRLQGAAKPGEVLLTEDVYRQVAELFPDAETRVCHLKGIEKPVSAYVLQASAVEHLQPDAGPLQTRTPASGFAGRYSAL